jgi:hypothetical protein
MDVVLTRENYKLAERIYRVKPKVGTIEEWNRQWREFKKDSRRMQRYQKDRSYDPELYLKETLS